MTESTPSSPSLERLYAEQLARQMEGVAARLVRIVEDVQHEIGRIDDPGRPVPGYADLVSSVQNNLLWAVANMNLGSLTSTAQQADEYRIKGE